MRTRKLLVLLFFAVAACAPQVRTQDSTASPPIAVQSGPQEKGIRVLSLNLHGIKQDAALLKSVRAGGRDGANLMLFQEVVRPAGGKAGAVDRVAQSLGMEVFFARAIRLRNGDEEGLAIVSRYPLRERTVMRLPRVNLRWKSRARIALAASVQTFEGVVQVYNVHLDSRMGIKQRLRQLQPVTEAAAKVTIPVLIGGDFNTNPYGWFQHTLPLPGPNQAARMTEHMRELGFDSASPLHRPTSHWLGMQLDWLFVKRLRLEDAEIRPVSFSDHHMLRARLIFPQIGPKR